MRKAARAEESIDHLDRMAGGLNDPRDAVLFSFEGMNSLRAPSFSVEIAGEFLENCIEKNFHVS